MALIKLQELNHRRDPARLSPREVVARLAYWEEVFLDRLHVVRREPGATVPVVGRGRAGGGEGACDRGRGEELLHTFRERRAETSVFEEAAARSVRPAS